MISLGVRTYLIRRPAMIPLKLISISIKKNSRMKVVVMDVKMCNLNIEDLTQNKLKRRSIIHITNFSN